MSDSALPPGTGTLNGWKEIATFLGKSVRAVQRWERDFGLPVHRIKTPTGQVVYAFSAEIEAWRSAMDERRVDAGMNLADAHAGDSAADPGDQEGAGSERSLREALMPRFAWASLVAAAILITAIAGTVLIKKAIARPVAVAKYEIAGTSLFALTADNTAVWSHDFGWQPQPLKYADSNGLRTMNVDLDGDGESELLAVIHSPVHNGEPWRETVFCFSAAGRLRWSYTPTLSLTYDGRVFDGPWRQYHMTATTGPGRQRAWVSFGHHTWWPSFIVELDAGGKATPRYFQSGAIYGLSVWSAASGDFLVASGVDNEYARASLALLDVNSAPATSPQHARTGFHCESCPQAGPVFFAAFPRSDINRVLGFPYNSSGGVIVNGNELKVATEEAARDNLAGAIYYLRADFTIREAGYNDNYWIRHRALEHDGKLTHSPGDCPDVHTPVKILTWSQPHGWSEITTALTPAPALAR